MKTVGERHWTHGPLILGSTKLHGKLVKSFTEADAKPIKKLKTTVGITKIDGESVVYLGSNEETGCIEWDGAAVLVHAREDQGYFLERDRVKMIASIDPRTIPPKAWKPQGTITLAKAPVLFDIHAGDPEGAKRERKTTIPVPLAAGDYIVELAKGKALTKPYPSKVVPASYTFVRLRPPDWVQEEIADAAGVVDDGPVVASKELIAATKKLRSASGDAIPMVVAPRKHLASWKGLADNEDPDTTDYDRACAVNGVAALKIGGGQGLVISEPGGLLFWPTATGGLFVIWVGADSNAGCIAAALSIPDKEWKKQKAKLVVAKGAEDFVMFDSGSPGNTLKKNGKIGFDSNDTGSFRLAAGTYAIEACWNWEAKVQVGKKLEDTTIAALRLRRT